MAWRDWQDECLPLRFPKWQFSQNGLLPGIVKVTENFRGSDPWEAMLYFLAQHRSLDGKSPLDLLRAGEVGKVLRHAKEYSEKTWGHEKTKSLSVHVSDSSNLSTAGSA